MVPEGETTGLVLCLEILYLNFERMRERNFEEKFDLEG